MKEFIVCCSLIVLIAVIASPTGVLAKDPHHDVEDICSIERVEGGVEICCESNNDNDESSGDDDCITIMDGEDGSNGIDGIDGTSCTASRSSQSGCFVISCGDESSIVVCDGADGEDGTNGIDGTDGISCWDLNGNGETDTCHPQLFDMFDGVCPTAEDFFVDYECEYPPDITKAMLAAKSFDGECGVIITCSEYMITSTEFDSDTIDIICSYTEDTNDDGEFDALDCRGDDGDNGSNGEVGETGATGATGATGEDGANGSGGSNGSDGINGAGGQDGSNGNDGIGCIVVDNFDASCTIVCGASEVTVYDCGDGAVIEEQPVPVGLCGTFGGLTIVGMILPLGLMRFRKK